KLRSFAVGVAIVIAVFSWLYQADLIDRERFRTFMLSRLTSIIYSPSETKPPNAIEQRVELWESALRVSREHWINGIGVRGYRFMERTEDVDNLTPVISETTRLSTHPHQITLEIFLETG